MRSRLRRLNWRPFAARGSVVGLNFLSLLVIALLMTAEEFGRFAHDWAIVLTLCAVVSLGGPAYCLREGAARMGDPRRGLTRFETLMLAVVLPAVLLGLVVAAGQAVPRGLLDLLGVPAPQLVPSLLVCGGAWTVNLINHAIVPYWLAERTGFAMLVRDAGPQAILLALAGALALSGLLSPATLLGSFCAGCLALAAALVLGRVLAPAPDGPRWRAPGTVRAGGLPGFWGSSVLGTTTSQLDILLGGLVMEAADLGRYQILRRLANLVSLPQIVANWVVAVRLGSAAAVSDLPALQRLSREGAGLTLAPALVLVAGLVLAMPLFVWLYDLPAGAALWLPFGLLVAASLANVAGGVNFMLAAQSGREAQALLARLGGAGALAAVALALGGSVLPWPVALGLAVMVASATANAALCALLYRGLRIDTSLLCLLRRRSP